MTDAQTLTIESFSGEPDYYPIKEWVEQHSSRRVLFNLTSRVPDPSVWNIEWVSEHGSGRTWSYESFRDATKAFWEQVNR